ncbi:MAG: EamA family transporter [Actinomycetota bacterium]
MAVLLGLAVALTYGGADFLGGLASRRSLAAAVVLGSQLVGLAGAIVVALIAGWDALPAGDVARAIGAGAAGLVGVTALYRGLAVGRMGVVAPVSAVTSALLPIGWGLATGEDPSGLALVGVGLAVVAIGIVARAPDPDSDTEHNAALALALLAGIGFGISFVCFGGTGEDSGLAPVVIARLTSVPLVFVALTVRRQPPLPNPADRTATVATGVLDVTANALLLTAVRGELLSLVAPIASLYPAGTVLLARIVLREPIGRERLAGLALALAGLVCIAL